VLKEAKINVSPAGRQGLPAQTVQTKKATTAQWKASPAEIEDLLYEGASGYFDNVDDTELWRLLESELHSPIENQRQKGVIHLREFCRGTRLRLDATVQVLNEIFRAKKLPEIEILQKKEAAKQASVAPAKPASTPILPQPVSTRRDATMPDNDDTGKDPTKKGGKDWDAPAKLFRGYTGRTTGQNGEDLSISEAVTQEYDAAQGKFPKAAVLRRVARELGGISPASISSALNRARKAKSGPQRPPSRPDPPAPVSAAPVAATPEPAPAAEDRIPEDAAQALAELGAETFAGLPTSADEPEIPAVLAAPDNLPGSFDQIFAAIAAKTPGVYDPAAMAAFISTYNLDMPASFFQAGYQAHRNTSPAQT
jgi:hypothetical protein